VNDFDEEPDVRDVLQVQQPDTWAEPPVYVIIRGPIRAQEVPAKANGSKGYQVSDAMTTRVLTADPHRSRALVVSLAQPFRFAGTQGELGGQCAVWPAATPLEIKAVDELWVQCATAATTDTISVFQEHWAE
jgi:hypothetical protein